MLNNTLAGFYERDLGKLIDEINLFKTEDDLWRTQGLLKNSAGNLALHIAGGLNHLIGATLANTGYIRNRPLEFSIKAVDKTVIVSQLQLLIPIVTSTINKIDLQDQYPVPFDGDNRTNGYVLIQLLSHLNYHLGQVNYLRRILDS